MIITTALQNTNRFFNTITCLFTSFIYPESPIRVSPVQYYCFVPRSFESITVTRHYPIKYTCPPFCAHSFPNPVSWFSLVIINHQMDSGQWNRTHFIKAFHSNKFIWSYNRFILLFFPFFIPFKSMEFGGAFYWIIPNWFLY